MPVLKLKSSLCMLAVCGVDKESVGVWYIESSLSNITVDVYEDRLVSIVRKKSCSCLYQYLADVSRTRLSIILIL